MAQSSVTLFGILDVGVSHGSGSVNNVTKMNSGGINSSRFGVKGTEDLGGGLKANFWLEGDVNPNTGAGSSVNGNNFVNGASTSTASTPGGFSFNRQAFVGFSGNFGEVRLGRDYTPSFYLDAMYDPFGVNGVGTNALFGQANGYTASHLRSSNSVSYMLPGNLNGFSGQVMYGNNNATSNATYTAATLNGTAAGTLIGDDGKYSGFNIGYANGPVSAHVSSSTYKAALFGDVKTSSVAGSYDLGVAKLSAEYMEDKFGTATADGAALVKGNNQKVTGTLFGVTAPLGNGSLRASFVSRKVAADGYTNTNKFDQTSIGYVYNLSVRTGLYATYSSINNKGDSKVGANGTTTAIGTSSSGYDLGIRHSF